MRTEEEDVSVRNKLRLTFQVLTCTMADDSNNPSMPDTEITQAFTSWSVHILKIEKRAGGRVLGATWDVPGLLWRSHSTSAEEVSSGCDRWMTPGDTQGYGWENRDRVSPRKRTSPWHGPHLRVVEPGGGNSSLGWGVLSLSPLSDLGQVTFSPPGLSFPPWKMREWSQLNSKVLFQWTLPWFVKCNVENFRLVKLGQSPPTSEASNVHSLLQIHAHILRTSIYHCKCMSALWLVPCGLFGRHKFKLITFWWPFSNNFSLFFFSKDFLFFRGAFSSESQN